MRRIPLLLPAVLSGLPGLAMAQDAARVRAFDLSDASRVEIPLIGGGFVLERSGERQVDLVAEGVGGAFDLSEIEPGGLARRVASARAVPEASGARIRFILNCDCEYAARLSGGVLAIEFRDAGAARAAEALESAGAEATDEGEEAPRARIAGNEGRTAPRFSPAPPLRSAASDRPRPLPVLTGAAEEEVVIARQKLLEQLSRAADQGLLEFRSPEAAAMAPPPPEDEPRRPAAPEPEPEVAAAPEPEPEPEPEAETALADAPPPPPPPLELSVRSRTAIDKEFRADRAETLAPPAPCIADARLDPANWPDPGQFAELQAKLSAELLDEFDNPKPDSATALARLYVGAGFGAEARRLVEFYGEAIEDAPLLVDLSRIVEGSAPEAAGPVRAAGPCSGLASIWYRAAGLQPPFTPEAARARAEEIEAEMVAAFGVLPAPFRVLLGPPLIADLLTRGETELAERIDLLLRRIPGDHGPAFDLARARLLAETGAAGPEETEKLFSRLAGRDLPESRQALLHLVDSLISRGAEVPPDLAEALAAAAFVGRGGPLERKLKVAEIRARARAEGLPAALDAVQAELARSPGSALILRDAGHAALEEASAAETGALAYVRAVLAYRDEISPDMAGDAARRKVAEELTGLGLANAALGMLDPAIRRGAPDVRRAAARAHIALGEADQAMAALDGVEGPDAERLRAQADELAGRPGAALERLAALGGAEPEAQAALALRAGAWSEASVAGSPERRLLAAYMAGETTAPEGEAGSEAASIFLNPPRMEGEVTLEAAQSVMDASRAARELIKEALGDG